VVKNEWLCSKIAKAFGLPVANCEIVQFDGVKTLIVERFDRKLSQDQSRFIRLPQEDMCQALNISPDLKYQADGGPSIADIMKLLLGSSTAEQDREVFFKAQILFWLLAAIDGHAKNFSIFIEPEGKFRLTPLYDIISAYPLIAKKRLQKQKVKMAMALKEESNRYHWHNIQRRHFLSTAKHANFSPERAEALLNEMLDMVETVIRHVKAELPPNFPSSISTPIFEGILSMKAQLNT